MAENIEELINKETDLQVIPSKIEDLKKAINQSINELKV